jgi:hypothetical protein
MNSQLTDLGSLSSKLVKDEPARGARYFGGVTWCHSSGGTLFNGKMIRSDAALAIVAPGHVMWYLSEEESR